MPIGPDILNDNSPSFDVYKKEQFELEKANYVKRLVHHIDQQLSNSRVNGKANKTAKQVTISIDGFNTTSEAKQQGMAIVLKKYIDAGWGETQLIQHDEQGFRETTTQLKIRLCK